MGAGTAGWLKGTNEGKNYLAEGFFLWIKMLFYLTAALYSEGAMWA